MHAEPTPGPLQQGRFPIEFRARMSRGERAAFYVLEAMLLGTLGLLLGLLGSEWNHDKAWSIALFGLLVVLFLGPMIYWISAILALQPPRITLDAEGLTCVGALRSTRVCWDEIESQTLVNVMTMPEAGPDRLVLALKGRATLMIEFINLAPSAQHLLDAIEHATGLPVRTRITPANEVRKRWYREAA